MKDHYVWLIWSSAFLAPWLVLFLSNPKLCRPMWQASLATTLFGLAEPLFVLAYWNPPSIFELARHTGFDIERLIFAFAIGGIGTVLYSTFTRQCFVPINPSERHAPTHRLHLAALLFSFVAFVPLFFLPWNPIYPVLSSLSLGAIASVLCRPELLQKTFIGGLLFLGLYAVFMLGLKWLAPGYIAAVWNLPALQGGGVRYPRRGVAVRLCVRFVLVQCVRALHLEQKRLM